MQDYPMMEIDGEIDDAVHCLRAALTDFDEIFSNGDNLEPQIPPEYKAFREELEAIERQFCSIMERHPEIAKWLKEEEARYEYMADLADANSY